MIDYYIFPYKTHLFFISSLYLCLTHISIVFKFNNTNTGRLCHVYCASMSDVISVDVASACVDCSALVPIEVDDGVYVSSFVANSCGVHLGKADEQGMDLVSFTSAISGVNALTVFGSVSADTQYFT